VHQVGDQPRLEEFVPGILLTRYKELKRKFFLNRCTYQRLTIPEAAYVQLRRRPPEDEQGNARNM